MDKRGWYSFRKQGRPLAASLKMGAASVAEYQSVKKEVGMEMASSLPRIQKYTQ